MLREDSHNSRNVGRIIFEVGVVDDRDLAGSVLECRPDRATLARILFMTKEFPGKPFTIAARCAKCAQHLARTVY